MSGDTLTRAVSAADLPQLVASHFPESRAVAGKAGRVRCTWRSDSRDLNGALFRGRAGVWRLHDFVTGENWDAFSFCTDVLNMTRSSAASYLIRLAGLEHEGRDSSKPRHRSAVSISTAPDDLPAFPVALESWRRVWALLGQPLRLELQGAGREALEALAEWLADALRPVKARLEGMAAGVTLELCADAFMGVEARVCPCGKRWLSRLTMLEHDATGRGCSRVAFGCEPCGEFWTASELETAVQSQPIRPPIHAPAFNPLAKYQKKLSSLRGAR